MEESRQQLLKWWGISDYMDDIGEYLKEREANRPYFMFKSQQSPYRSTLALWLKELGIRRKMDRSCIHLAVYFLDIFMDNNHIPMEHIYLVPLVCLLLAAKYDERDVNIPKVAELNGLLRTPYLTQDFAATEVQLMRLMEWNLGVPTAAHFADFYSLYVLDGDDVKRGYKWSDALEHINNFLDLVLLEVRLTQAQPSLMGAAVMAATRSTMKLLPIWTPLLTSTTHFHFLEISGTVQYLLQKILPKPAFDLTRGTRVLKRERSGTQNEHEEKRVKIGA